MSNDIKYARLLYENLGIAEDVALEIARLYRKEFDLTGIFTKVPLHTISKNEAEILLMQVKYLRDKQNIINFANSFLKGEKRSNLIRFVQDPNYEKKYSKLETFFDVVDNALALIVMNELEIMEKGYDEIIDNSYYKTCYDIQKTLGKGFRVPGASVPLTWSGNSYKERLETNTQQLRRDIRNHLTVAFFSGYSISQAKEWLKATMYDGAKTTRRLIRTEATYLANQSMLQGFRDCGVQYYRYVAILDLRTSLMCRRMDGKIFRTNEAVAGFNLPPLHPWCRSSIAPVTKDVIYINGTKIPKNIPYKVWKEKFGKDKHESQSY